MSDSAQGSVLVVGGSTRERERWVRALSELTGAVGAADGPAALDRLSDEVEVVLVHRDLSGEEPAAFVSAVRDRGHAVRAALLTPAAPTTDIVEQGFDAWFRTPVDEGRLRRGVESLFACRAYDRAITDLYQLARQRTASEPSVTPERVQAAREAADEALADIDTADREALLANSPTAFESGGPEFGSETPGTDDHGTGGPAGDGGA